MTEPALDSTASVDPALVSTTRSAGSWASSTGEGARTAEPPSVRGSVIGRYVILSLLGMGGMGAVYAAYDPELERKIALKLLRADATRSDSARLLREARALAKLAHPNVVSVHDVGTVGAAEGADDVEVFIAMEFIEGVTAAKWLRQRRRSTREILDMYVAAARGLAAAHKANLIHRDFKPENVMVGDDGRVRVMDFGLARRGEAPALDVRPDESLPGGSHEALDVRLTRDGALLGTPAYMAAEQWRGEGVDARTDQFAFCVALWEALHEARPFAGSTIHAIMLSVTRGRLAPPPRGARRVPAWVRRVLERGLSTAPEQRFPTMDALLVELERGNARRRRWAILLGLGAAAGLVVAAVGARRQQVAACEAEGAVIAETWNDAVKRELRRALVGTGVSYAQTTHDKAVPLIDQWTEEWSAMREQACREATIEGTRSPEMYGLTAACLDEQREALAELLAVLRGSQATDVQRVVPAVAGLSRLVSCAERSSLERRPRPPEDPTVRQEVLALRRDVMRVQGLLGAGRYLEGLAAAEALYAAAEALGYRPLTVETLALVGKLAARLDAKDRAEEALRRVYVEAGGMGADELAAEAAVQLVSTVGVWNNRPAEGLQWGLSAEMLIDRLGPGQELLGASLANNLAQIHGARSSYQEALRFNERALAIREKILGPSHPDVAEALNIRGSLQRAMSAYAAALESHGRALAIREAALGPDHPDVATTLNNLGLVQRFLGSFEQAQASLERALAVRTTAFGADHPDVATTLGNLGVLLHMRGRYDAGEARLEQALAIRDRLGSDPRSTAIVLHDLGLLSLARGRFARSRESLERALAIRRSKLDADHPAIASSLEGLGLLNHAIGEYAEAQALLESVLSMRRKKVDRNHPDIARVLAHLAQVHAARGSDDEARELAREALRLCEGALGPGHPDTAMFLNTLAQIEQRFDGERARALARRALMLSVRTRGADHPMVASSHERLGALDLAQGAYEQAEGHYRKALEIREAALGPDALEVADALLGLGDLAALRGRPEEAVPLLERAVRTRIEGRAPAHRVAEARFSLARALRDAPGRSPDRERAHALATEALDGYRAAGEPFAADAAAVASWSRP